MDRYTKNILPLSIRTARIELGLTQRAFGQRIESSEARVCAWENAHGMPTDKTLDAIVSVFNINREFLEYGTGNIFDTNRTENNFILKVSDTHADAQRKLSNYKIAKHNVCILTWPLYSKNHADIKFKSDDNVVIYTVGSSKHPRAFIAVAKIAEVTSYENIHLQHSLELNDKIPTSVLLMKHVSWFDHPINVVDIMEKLSFNGTNKKKWGQLLQNGCTTLTSDDFNVILRAAYTYLKVSKYT